MYKIYVRDQYFNRVAEVDDYTNLELIQRFNAPGSWLLELPTNSNAAKEIIKTKAGIIVIKDGQTILSGPVTSRRRRWTSEKDTLMINGSDDLYFIAENLAYPCDPPFTANDYDVRTGAAETIIKQYVDNNIGANARTDRRIQSLTVEPSAGLGAIITGRARFHTLLELSQSLALAGGNLGFRAVQLGSGIVFQVYQLADKSNSVYFSPLLGNLRDFEYTSQNPETNSAIVGGGGEGTARILIAKSDSDSLAEFWRSETFIDRRDTTDTAELNQALDEELKQNAEKTSLSISPIDTDALKFGRDYQLGDKVSVVLTQPNEVITTEELQYFISANQIITDTTDRIYTIQQKLEVLTDIVREVKITINQDGETVTPTIGTSDSLANPIKGIFDRMKKVTKRISNLERR
jgi:prophage tail gpP-like protein